MNRLSLALVALLGILVFSLSASGATFVTNSAQLSPGQRVSSKSHVNGNLTVFIFSEVTTNPTSKKKSAFVQWAPLAPKASGYRNGTMLDEKSAIRVWINGVWYTLAFDGRRVRID